MEFLIYGTRRAFQEFKKLKDMLYYFTKYEKSREVSVRLIRLSKPLSTSVENYYTVYEGEYDNWERMPREMKHLKKLPYMNEELYDALIKVFLDKVEYETFSTLKKEFDMYLMRKIIGVGSKARMYKNVYKHWKRKASKKHYQLVKLREKKHREIMQIAKETPEHEIAGLGELFG